MQYIHIKKLEEYHPGYKDRSLIWCKTYFKMMNTDPEFEMLCEIDKWRFVAFVMLELQLQKPIPLNEEWLKRKGFNFKNRSISLTLQMLHTFIEVSKACNGSSNLVSPRVEYSRVDKSRVEKKDKSVAYPFLTDKSFKDLWEAWLEVRRKMKAPNTERALDITLKKLHTYSLDMACQMVEQSVERGWRGVFEIKEKKKNDITYD